MSIFIWLKMLLDGTLAFVRQVRELWRTIAPHSEVDEILDQLNPQRLNRIERVFSSATRIAKQSRFLFEELAGCCKPCVALFDLVFNMFEKRAKGILVGCLLMTFLGVFVGALFLIWRVIGGI